MNEAVNRPTSVAEAHALRAFDTVQVVVRGGFLGFAEAVWPEAASAKTAHRRSAYRRAAGALLARMARKGLVQHVPQGYTLTPKGRDARHGTSNKAMDDMSLVENRPSPGETLVRSEEPITPRCRSRHGA